MFKLMNGKLKLKVSSIIIISFFVMGGFSGLFSFEDNNVVEAATIYVGPNETYKTITAGLNAAKSGDTVYVYNGTYNENVEINKTITLIGERKNDTIIDGGGTGSVIHIRAADGISVQNFTIRNSGNGFNDAGIKIQSVRYTLITNNNITLNNQYGILNYHSFYTDILNNNITFNDMEAIYFNNGTNNNVSNNNIYNNGYYGITLDYSNGNIFLGNRIVSNNNSGFNFRRGTNNLIKFNTIQNHNWGIAWRSTCEGSRIYLNNFINNNKNVYGTDASRTWNSEKPWEYNYNGKNHTNNLGNYWDDYTGQDTNGDGIGDTPYNIGSYKDSYPLMKPIENYLPTLSSIQMSLNALSSKRSFASVSLSIKTASANATMGGALTGTIDFYNLEIVIFNSSSYAGKGFFTSNYTAVLEGKTYKGNWRGMLFNKSSERKFYLKGTVTGELKGITDGYLKESTSGSGKYDLYASTWTLNHLEPILTFLTLTMNGNVKYTSSQDTSSSIFILQAKFMGNASGYYKGPLDIVITNVRINDVTSQYFGIGFSIITYISKYGSGVGWTYDITVSAGTAELNGYFTKPIWGITVGTLYECEPIVTLSLNIIRIDIGLPPSISVDVDVWGPTWVSPGQTMNYFLEYSNMGLKDAKYTDVIMTLPKNVSYSSNTGSGSYNAEKHQVVWTTVIKSKSRSIVSVICNVSWGLPQGTKLPVKGDIYDNSKQKNLATDAFVSIVRVARDPNAKYGYEGNIPPGEKLNYTIEYENEGKGIAFGVYVTDTLDEDLDDSTLKIGPVISTKNHSIIAPAGTYNPYTRTITWSIGEVGPGEGGYANISINVRQDAPLLSVIINYATVYFPSVPEITRTNGIITIVNINQRPVADAGSNKVAYTLENVTFDASLSYDPDGVIVNYTWDFGDGNLGYDEIMTHQYLDDGTYKVKLTVKDKWDAYNSHEIYVEVLNRAPHAVLEADLNEVFINETVKFNAESSLDLDGDIIDYYFDFGDGSNSGWIKSPAASHKYDVGNTIYSVRLKVKDDDGKSNINIAEVNITVHEVPKYNPVIDSTFPTSILINEDFEEWSLSLTDFESHTNPGYGKDDLKWYVTGNSGTIFNITGDNSTGTNADTFTFTSISNQYGVEVLTYHLYDTEGVEATIQQTIEVRSVNDPPDLKPFSDMVVNVSEEITLNLEDYISDVESRISDLTIETNYPEQVKVQDSLLVIAFESSGDYQVEIDVLDGEFKVTGSFLVKVLDLISDDSDGDGMPDSWEELYGLDPYDPGDAGIDNDKDFLTNLQEFRIGTDPTKADTDSDGFIDSIDEYPTDPTRPGKREVEEKSKGNDILIFIFAIIIVVVIIVLILFTIIKRKRADRIAKPFDDDEFISSIRDDIIQGTSLRRPEMSDNTLLTVLEVKYQRGEISEETYLEIEREKTLEHPLTNNKNLSGKH
ncbi:MAG: PKD domain-containing protein [Thermoplasmata archaeon]|nr:MAG: PKD domain-containing protein [Thermoplasmata archaeon]